MKLFANCELADRSVPASMIRSAVDKLPRGSNSLKRTSGLQMTKPLCCLHPMIFHSVIHVWLCMPVGCNEAAYVVGQLSRHCEKQASMCMTLGQVQATLSTTWPAKFFVFCLRAARKCALRTWIWISLYNISLQLATVKHMWGVKYLFSVVVEKVSEQKGNLLQWDGFSSFQII